MNKANEESYDAILTFLGDEATFQKYAQGHKWRLLAWTKNPRAVDFIAAGLMVNDDNPAYETPSHDAASQLAVVLLDWPEIPSEVSGWVMKFRGWIMNARDTRQLMREWWLANEAAWRRRDFAALKPGRDLVGRDLIDPRTLPSAPAPPPVLPAAATPAPPPIPESPAPTATPELLPPQDHGSPWAFLSVVAACIAALAGVLWLWRKTG